MGKHIVFRRYILWPFICYVQTYNSVGINPCAITAWMMSTCNGGGEFFDCLRVCAFWSHHFIAYVFYSLPAGYSYSGPDGFDANNLCYCNTVAYSLFSACGACQGREWIKCGRYVFSTLGGLCIYPSLAGRFGRPIARRYCLPRRESPVAAENVLCSTL